MLKPVASAILYKGDSLYLSSRAFTKSYPGLWQCPGGKIDDGEDTVTALVREVYEETGLYIAPERFTFIQEFVIHDSIGVYREYMYYAELKDYEVPKNMEPDKQSDWRLFSIVDVHRMSLEKRLVPGLDNLVNYLVL